MQPLLDLARRGAWIALGLLSVGIGAIGIVVPGLPTTVFFIIAAACFSKSSPRLERWVLGLPRIGPAVGRYRAGLGIPLRAKYWAIGSIVVFSALAVVIINTSMVQLAVAAAGVIGVWYVGRRVPTTPAEALESTG